MDERWGDRSHSSPLGHYAADTDTDNFCKELDFIPLSFQHEAEGGGSGRGGGGGQGRGGGGGGRRGGGGGGRGHFLSPPIPVRSQTTGADERLPWFRDLERPKRGRTAAEASFSQAGYPGSKRRRRSASVPAGGKWDVIWKDLPEYRPQMARRPHICEYCYTPGHSKKKCKHVVSPCILCGKVGHAFKKCPEWHRYWKPKRRKRFCDTCNARSHSHSDCPNHWRQLHNTTHASERRMLNLDSQLRTDKVYCYFCGRQGHFGFQCARRPPEGRIGVGFSVPMVYKYTEVPGRCIRPSIPLYLQVQRSNMNYEDDRTQSALSFSSATVAYQPQDVASGATRALRKDQAPLSQSSGIGEAALGTNEGSWSCVNMELASSDSDDDGSVSYIVIDEVRGDVSSRSGSVSPEPQEDKSSHRSQQPSSVLRKKPSMTKEPDVNELNRDVKTVVEDIVTHSHRRNLAADVLIPSSLIKLRPVIPHPSWSMEKVLKELSTMEATVATNSEQVKRFRKWREIVTSLCRAWKNLMGNASRCLKKAKPRGPLTRARAQLQGKTAGVPQDNGLAPGHTDGMNTPAPLVGEEAPGHLDEITDPGHLDGTSTPTPASANTDAPSCSNGTGTSRETSKHEHLEEAITPNPLQNAQLPQSLNHPMITSLLKRLRDLYHLSLLWMMQEGLSQRRSSEESALRSCSDEQLAFHPNAFVYPVRMNLLPPQPSATPTSTVPPSGTSVALSLIDNNGTLNVTGGKPPPTRPCLPFKHNAEEMPVVMVTISQDSSQKRQVSLRSKPSTPPKHAQSRHSTPKKSPTGSQGEASRPPATPTATPPRSAQAAANQSLDDILASFETAPVTAEAQSSQSETRPKQENQLLNQKEEGRYFFVSADSKVNPVSLQSASLELLQVVDRSYLDQRSMDMLQKALEERKRATEADKQGRLQEVGSKDSSVPKANCDGDPPEIQKGNSTRGDDFCSRVQFHLNPLLNTRIKEYLKELSSSPNIPELDSRMIMAVDVLDRTLPCDTTLQTLANLATVAVKRSSTVVAELKAVTKPAVRSKVDQKKEMGAAAHEQLGPQLVLRKRQPVNESVPAAKKCKDEAQEVDGSTKAALLPAEEAKGDNDVTAGVPSNTKKRRQRAKRQKLKKAKAAVDSDKRPTLSDVPHFIAPHLQPSSTASAENASAKVNGDAQKSLKQETSQPSVQKSPPAAAPATVQEGGAVDVCVQASSQSKKRKDKVMPSSSSDVLSGVLSPSLKSSVAVSPPNAVTLQSLCSRVELRLKPLVANSSPVVPVSPPVANSNQNVPTPTEMDDPWASMSKRAFAKMRKAGYRAKRKLAKKQSAERKKQAAELEVQIAMKELQAAAETDIQAAEMRVQAAEREVEVAERKVKAAERQVRAAERRKLAANWKE